MAAVLGSSRGAGGLSGQFRCKSKRRRRRRSKRKGKTRHSSRSLSLALSHALACSLSRSLACSLAPQDSVLSSESFVKGQGAFGRREGWHGAAQPSDSVPCLEQDADQGRSVAHAPELRPCKAEARAFRARQPFLANCREKELRNLALAPNWPTVSIGVVWGDQSGKSGIGWGDQAHSQELGD